MVEWGWDLLRSFVGAGAGTAAVTGAVALLRDRKKKRAEATYLALRLAVTLEKFASECSELISSNKSAELSREHEFPDWNYKLPALDPFPADAEGWKAIDANAAANCLNFPNRISDCQRKIYDDIAYHSDDVDDVARRVACRVGLEAWDLAQSLRKSFDIKLIKPAYDYHAHLLREKEKTEAEEAAEVDFAREMFATSGRGI